MNSTSANNLKSVLIRLQSVLPQLETDCRLLDLPMLVEQEWYQSFGQKLLPQLGRGDFLVIGVVGGTNIGKSTVYNHLAGQHLSAICPTAAGTKHPSLLVPIGFTKKYALEDLFPEFTLKKSVTASETLEERDEDILFWQEQTGIPENLLLLDTPDIDSNAPVNWKRADKIRRSADVLVAVLTQQKYNDAAIKTFFRQAATEEKVVVVLFNQCRLPEDEAYWRGWLQTFCEETNLAPHAVYLAPMDRAAIEKLELPFYDQPKTTWDTTTGPTSHEPRNLLLDFSQFRFKEIKQQTLQGTLAQLLDKQEGLPAYLDRVEQESHAFQSVIEQLADRQWGQIDRWPTSLNKLITQEVRQWWRNCRSGWSGQIHHWYDSVNHAVIQSAKFVVGKHRRSKQKPIATYLREEWPLILQAIETIYERLEVLAPKCPSSIRQILDQEFLGTRRAEVIHLISIEQQKADWGHELAQIVQTEMETFQTEQPKMYAFLRSLDQMAAVVRPAASVALFMTGFGALGHALTPLGDIAAQSTLSLAGQATAGVVTATVGESTVSSGVAKGRSCIEAKFRQLQQRVIDQRLAWLDIQLNHHLLKKLPDLLQQVSAAIHSIHFQETKELLAELQKNRTQNS